MTRSQPLASNPSAARRVTSMLVVVAAFALVNVSCGTTGEPAPVAPDERMALSFEVLDLAATPLGDALEKGERTSEPFPSRVTPLDGRAVSIEGYMIPLQFDGDDVVEFLLLRDNLQCCMGGAPTWGHWLIAKADGESSTAYPQIGAPVRVDGEFGLVHPADWSTDVEGVYQLRHWSVRPRD